MVYFSSLSCRKQYYCAPRFLHHDEWCGTNHEAPLYALPPVFCHSSSFRFACSPQYSFSNTLQPIVVNMSSWAELTLITPLIHLRYVYRSDCGMWCSLAQTPGPPFAVAIKFCTVTHNICGPSVRNVHLVSILTSKILRWFLYCYEICASPVGR